MTLPAGVQDPQHHWSYQDYLGLPDDGRRYQLIEGSLHMSPAPSTVHQQLSRRLQFLFYQLEQQGLGWIYNAPTDLWLDEHSIVQPDLIFLNAQQGHLVKRRYIQGAPFLVIEILSPGSARLDRVKKMRLYAKHQIPHYWLLDPENQVLELLKLNGNHYLLETSLELGDRWEPSDFPGIVLDLEELFRSLLPVTETPVPDLDATSGRPGGPEP